MKIKVCLTMGDPAGIGPMIIGRAIKACAGLPAEFTVIGSAKVFSLLPRALRLPEGVVCEDMDNLRQGAFSIGKVSAAAGKASMEYLERAMEMMLGAGADCLVTCPISKTAVHAAGFKWPGHTEYLAHKSSCAEPEMVLLNDRLRFLTLTRHVSLRRVASCIKPGRLTRAVASLSECFRRDLRIKHPRIIVCGLNPHSGDNGVIGSEEVKLIAPEVKDIRRRFKGLQGPVSADVAISSACAGNYDCVIAMYHDQAMIPLKLTGFSSGVNLTLGLPFVRTSPLHGTAFDIAGSAPCRADPSSLISALRLAIKCALNRKKD